MKTTHTLLNVTLLFSCVQLVSCRTQTPATSAPIAPISSAKVISEKQVPGQGAPLTNQQMNRMLDQDTSVVDRERLVKQMMRSSNHVEGVIRQ
ncbi:MAG: hypothetical protein IPK22_24460 [Verrucomicrobiaceae bacterium]|nr:hypothetical protein [Verrucomicrobiaceae bacterium]